MIYSLMFFDPRLISCRFWHCKIQNMLYFKIQRVICDIKLICNGFKKLMKWLSSLSKYFLFLQQIFNIYLNIEFFLVYVGRSVFFTHTVKLLDILPSYWFGSFGSSEAAWTCWSYPVVLWTKSRWWWPSKPLENLSKSPIKHEFRCRSTLSLYMKRNI